LERRKKNQIVLEKEETILKVDGGNYQQRKIASNRELGNNTMLKKPPFIATNFC